MNNLKDTILGILFYEADSLSVGELSDILGEKPEDIRQALSTLKEEYSGERSIIMLNQGESYQLVLSGPARDILLSRDIKEREGELSRAALETLSCIIYLGSATKSQIDYIRGVQSSYMLRSLSSRGLIARSGRSGRDTVYVPTVETLRFMGIAKIEDMPDYEKISAEFNQAILNSNKSEE